MALLLSDAELDARRAVAVGPLAPLTSSLLADNALVAARGARLPTWKARFTRGYARCMVCGGPLAFDPWQPHRHRGMRCQHVTVGNEADGWWAVGAQLWAADRAVHAATLAALTDDAQAHEVACGLLETIAVQATMHSERDSVLGPSGPFFSTYLDSLWVLSLAIASDLLDADARWRGPADPAGARAQRVTGLVAEQLLLPTARRIARYDEGASNRQRWNDAALLAVAHVVDDRDLVAELLDPTHGALARAETGLLADGSWTEGENYHQFAVRALWYLARMHHALGAPVPPEMERRRRLAWGVPLRTRWPDQTLAARRDAQYGVSLHQWRWAEWCELARADIDDPLVTRVLRDIYAWPGPRLPTGRLVSTGESEVNWPATRISQADLGWKSLLVALPEPPRVDHEDDDAAVLLPSQGLAIIRPRARRGAVRVALDYGHPGGGHGHPDRLALTLADGAARWLDDWGTGTYADPLLDWYRSALAHTAPIIDGGGQEPRAGHLTGWQVDEDGAWMRATLVEPRRAVELTRAVFVGDDLVIDIIDWTAPDGAPARIDVPHSIGGVLHAGDTPLDMDGIDVAEQWQRAAMGSGSDDGTRFIADVRAAARPAWRWTRLDAEGPDSARVALHASASVAHDIWQCRTPGPPEWSARAAHGAAVRTVMSAHAARGRLVHVWDLRDVLASVAWADDALVLTRRDGAVAQHRADATGWHVAYRERASDGVTRERQFTERPPATADDGTAASEARNALPDAPPPRIEIPTVRGLAPAAPTEALRVTLGREAFLGSDASYDEYPTPRAMLSLWADDKALALQIDLEKQPIVLGDPSAENRLDTWPAELHGDAMQLAVDTAGGARHEWLIVARPGHGALHVRTMQGDRPPPTGHASRASGALSLSVRVPRGNDPPVSLALVIGLRRATSERRDGALVFPPRTGWVYGLGPKIGSSIPGVSLHYHDV